MNENRQAEALADWLDRAGADGPPTGVDDDVVEAVFALRPDLAPKPRVSVDDILAGVREGPLSGAPVWEEIPEPANQPLPAGARWSRYIGASTLGLLAAAAAALLVVHNTQPPPATAPAVQAAPVEPTGPQAAGAASGSADAAQPPPPARPAAEPAAVVAEAEAPKAEEVPTEELKAADLQGALAAVDAVADADLSAEAQTADEAGAVALDAAPATTSPAPPSKTIAEAEDLAEGPTANTADQVAEVTTARAEKAEERSKKAAEAPASPPRAAEPAGGAAKPAPAWATGMDPAAADDVQAALDKAGARARRGDYKGAISTLEGFIHSPARAGMHVADVAAGYALQAGDARRAAALCEKGLRLSAGATPERARLEATLERARKQLATPQ